MTVKCIDQLLTSKNPKNSKNSDLEVEILRVEIKRSVKNLNLLKTFKD